MNTQDLLIQLNLQFPDNGPFEVVTKCAAKDNTNVDYECKLVEEQFANKPREELSDYDCSMLIIDSALLLDEAFKYFIPRVAKAVFEDEGDAYMFGNTLKRLKNLNPMQVKVINSSIKACDEIENELG